MTDREKLDQMADLMDRHCANGETISEVLLKLDSAERLCVALGRALGRILVRAPGVDWKTAADEEMGRLKAEHPDYPADVRMMRERLK
jgi:hypothetical protein